MSLSSQQAAPIVVLHGGPSLPSDYCYPLAKHVPYQSILFYDQLGCGKSDEPNNLKYYSIDQAVDDLEAVLGRLSIRQFHLYGHSYGGILAYEYLKRSAERATNESDGNDKNSKCLSVILSSAPTSIQQMEDDWDAMSEALSFPDLFLPTHLCRTPELPKPLQDAYANAGTVWSGTASISDYKAQPSKPKNGDGDKPNEYYMPSALILRGEHDVVTEICSKGWKKELLSSRFVRERTLADCSHHGLLENGPMYGGVIDSYFGEYD
jgi:proline iminopeptidase